MIADVTRALGTDYYLLEELLSDEEREIRDRVRAFADREVIPVINDYWDKAQFPFELVPKIAELNIVGTIIEGYGCPGMSRLAAGLVAVEMGRGDGSINTFFGVHSGLAMGTIAMLGSEEQREKWLPTMARMEKIGAFALTEPRHGSDSVMLETSARSHGDEYVLNGEKRWIGNATFADLIVIWARDVEDGQVKGFVVEKGADGYPEGYSTELITGNPGKLAGMQGFERVEFDRARAVHGLKVMFTPVGVLYRDAGQIVLRYLCGSQDHGGESYVHAGHVLGYAEFDLAGNAGRHVRTCGIMVGYI